jgi:hypothetical protein
MNSTTATAKADRLLLAGAVFAVLGWLAMSIAPASAFAKSKSVDVEIPYEATLLKTPAIAAPYYLNAAGGNDLVVSNESGGVFSVTLAGKVKELASKAKVKHPGGVAVAPKGFGSYAGQVFVITADSPKGPCRVDRIEKGGAVAKFADLPDAGGAKPTECRDLAFGPAGTGYAGKLFAETSGNSAIYAIDSAGKAKVFGDYAKPLGFELDTINFTTAHDPKAPNAMLVGMRPKMNAVAKIGRLGVVGPDGKLADNPYMVGFTRPTGVATSPAGWGSYPDMMFIADAAKMANAKGAGDGLVLRVYKGIARSFAGNLGDPISLKFIGRKMVISDPAARGRAGEGAIVVISSML